MNTETGRIYRTQAEIDAAIRRGEPLEPIGPGVAEQDKAGGSVDINQIRKYGGAEPIDVNGQPYFDRDGRRITRRERRERTSGKVRGS